MNTPEYISALNKLYKAGIATEHSYRGDLKILIENIFFCFEFADVFDDFINKRYDPL